MGRDVQFIPHVTGETKMIFRNLAVKTKADVVLIEIGGTIGDYENVFALEAVRELMYEEGRENVCLINLTYILEPKSLSEFKSKAAQLGLRKLMEMGLHPDIVVCRSNKAIPYKIKEKVSLAVNVNIDHVVGFHNVDSIYTLPSFMNNLKIDDMVVEILGLNGKFKKNEAAVRKWTSAMVVDKPRKTITVAMAGKYVGAADTYISILKALEHCEAKLQCKINVKWIEATDIEKGMLSVKDTLKGVDGLIVPGGFGVRGIEGKITCIEFARRNKIPYLGLCYGFQMAVIEFARNVLGLKQANTTECGKKTPHHVICILPEKEEIGELGGTLRLGGLDVVVTKGTKAFELYGKTKIRERFRHRFNVNTKYIDRLVKAGLVFSGKAPKKRIMQILELPKNKHPFFIATQFHPEFTSKPLEPNPMFVGFVGACLKRK